MSTDTEGQRSQRHIAHISTVHSLGDARILYREAHSLSHAGYRVTVVGVAKGGLQSAADVAIVPLKAISGRLRRMLTSWAKGLLVVSSTKADIYHFHDPELLPAAMIAKAYLGKRVVFDAHEDVGLIALKDWLPNWIKRPLLAIMDSLDKHCAKRLDGWVVTSFRHEKYYRPLAKRLAVFHNFPAPRFLQARDAAWVPYEQRAKRLIHLGTVSLSRLKTIVEVGKQFLDDLPEWSFMILGMHPPMLEWFDQNVTGDIRQRLIGLGQIPHQDVAAHLCTARIGINYHRVGSRQLQHVIPLKVFEYLSSGLPTITTKVPALHELIGDCPSVTWAQEDPEEYRQELYALARRDDLPELCQKARNYADERLNCLNEAKNLTTLYSQILSERS